MPRLNMFRKLADKIVDIAKKVEKPENINIDISILPDSLEDKMNKVLDDVVSDITSVVTDNVDTIQKGADAIDEAVSKVEDVVTAAEAIVDEVVKPKKNKK